MNRREPITPAGSPAPQSQPHHSALGRPAFIWGLNVILPGAGLIIRRREWLGVALAVVFGICGNVALAGWLIAPAAVPDWLPGAAVALGAATWAASQASLYREGELQTRRAGGVTALLGLAEAALDRNDTTGARAAMESAAALDDENVALHVLWARLFALEGDRGSARRAWKKVLKLDIPGAYRAEAEQALSSVGPASPSAECE